MQLAVRDHQISLGLMKRLKTERFCRRLNQTGHFRSCCASRAASELHAALNSVQCNWRLQLTSSFLFRYYTNLQPDGNICLTHYFRFSNMRKNTFLVSEFCRELTLCSFSVGIMMNNVGMQHSDWLRTKEILPILWRCYALCTRLKLICNFVILMRHESQLNPGSRTSLLSELALLKTKAANQVVNYCSAGFVIFSTFGIIASRVWKYGSCFFHDLIDCHTQNLYGTIEFFSSR